MTPDLPRLHALTDAVVLGRDDFALRASALARSRAVAMHARAPGLSARRLIAVTGMLRAAAASTGAAVFVNDRVDVARIAGVQGVHLPADGLPTPAVRALVGTGTWIGRSAHGVAEAQSALDAGADYVFLGPIWQTDSHPDRPGLGPGAIAAVGSPRVIAIGGITPTRVTVCRAAGAYGVAAISALWSAADPAAAADEMLVLLGVA